MNPCLPGISLRTSSFAVGFIEVILAIVGGLFYTIGLMAIGQYQNPDQLHQALGESFVVPFLSDPTDKDNIGKTMLILLSISLVCCLIYGIAGCLLLTGVKKQSLTILKYWKLYKTVVIVTTLIYIFLTLILASTTVLGLTMDIISICFQSYFLWIVHSYSLQLKDDQTLTMIPSIRKSGEKIEVVFPLDTR